MPAIKYLSLDEARIEKSRRMTDIALREAVEKELGIHLIKELGSETAAILCRPIISPDNGYDFFEKCARFINCKPVCLEFLDDKFVMLNSEKSGLGRLHASLNGRPGWYEFVDCNKEQGKKLSEVSTLVGGKSLSDIHHSLCDYAGIGSEIADNSNWFRQFSGPGEYYYYFLLNFVIHGVYFDLFDVTMDDDEADFVASIVAPAAEKINQKFGVYPMLVKLYPDNQNEEEDNYWFSYNRFLNDKIVEMAQKSGLRFHEINLR